jgi:hypothetical protein
MPLKCFLINKERATAVLMGDTALVEQIGALLEQQGWRFDTTTKTFEEGHASREDDDARKSEGDAP